MPQLTIPLPPTPPAHTSVNMNAQSVHKRRHVVAEDSAQLQPKHASSPAHQPGNT